MDLYLAPINSLSNYAFRKLCLSYEADFVFTEMIWAERILRNDKFEKSKLIIDKTDESKTIIQIITEDTKNIEPFLKIIKKGYPLVKEINFNMGCPQSTLLKKCLGGGILKDKLKMKEFALTFSIVCKKYGFKPSVKIRIGVDSEDLKSYLTILKESGISKIYIHARTLKQGYTKPANYESLKELKNDKNFKNLNIIVNGDVKDLKTYNQSVSSIKCSGVMIGRGALNDPSIFLKLKEKSHPDKKSVMLTFLDLAKNSPIAIVKRNLSYMTLGVVKGAKLREEINNSKTINNLKEKINKICI